MRFKYTEENGNTIQKQNHDERERLNDENKHGMATSKQMSLTKEVRYE